MQTNDPINTIPLQQFMQVVKTADASNQKEIKIPITQAKALAFALGTVMANHQGRLEKLIIDNKSSSDDEVVTVQLDGGNSWK
jgi:hypothetical protein|tara:strand:- start:1301 stop:1549 length:249 start_codon:yes stop_codon:yes gene_type:complete